MPTPRSRASRRRSSGRRPAPPDGAEPGMCWWRAEQVEALLELGLVDDAVERLDAWEADARRLRRNWVVAHATRCRGLVAASEGDSERAVLLLDEAVSLHEAVGDPFGRARALLALGVARRRARQKRPARDAIEAACAGFDELGAARWAGPSARGAGADRRADAHRRPDTRGAPRRRSRGEREDERRGRRGALPRGADGVESPDSRLRQARSALANGARPPAGLRGRPSKVQTF